MGVLRYTVCLIVIGAACFGTVPLNAALARSKGSGLKMCAFNIQILGSTKLRKADVMDSIIQILSRYDVVLVQEIRDKRLQVVPTLLKMLNRGYKKYDVRFSERLGRKSHKEQYAYFYRTDKVEAVDTYQFQDPKDVFQREPFAVRFRIRNSYEFAMVGIHIDPDDAVQELNDLAHVSDLVKSHWNLENVLLAGDFNADCTYVRAKHWPNIRLWTEPQYSWLVGHEADTTTSKTDCAYDRFVATGRELIESVVPGSVSVYRYDLELGLDYKQTKRISDHYPIEVELLG